MSIRAVAEREQYYCALQQEYNGSRLFPSTDLCLCCSAGVCGPLFWPPANTRLKGIRPGIRGFPGLWEVLVVVGWVKRTVQRLDGHLCKNHQSCVPRVAFILVSLHLTISDISRSQPQSQCSVTVQEQMCPLSHQAETQTHLLYVHKTGGDELWLQSFT